MEQKINSKFLNKLGKSAGQNHAMLKQVHGDGIMTLKSLYAWFKTFIGGYESAEDEHRSGRPTTVDNARRHNTTLVNMVLLNCSTPRIPQTCHYRTFSCFLKLKCKGAKTYSIMQIEAAVTRELKAVPMEEFSTAFDDLHTRC
ncbi:hypothetical protein AVEN_118099-1 [Araneus ventricosus]|uniref:Mos1 transposase HTH domain-containing protein n=1 Tax=Araneus ventricosus TaxID=182803 RepID=A0A4Y2J0E0_ARAVE|nr:hypothetical protein AVEN_118099-1 [Araneus ventricosus]